MSTEHTPSYSLPPEMHEFQRGDTYLFFDPVNFVWFQTDRLGKGIIDGLEAGGSLAAAAGEVARLAAAPQADAEVYALRAIGEMTRIGFVHEGEYQQRHFASPVMESPVILYLHLTSRCNLRCPYCYNQENRSELRSAPLGTFEQFAQVIDQAAELGFRDIKLTGGEPLLNRDTLPLARHARSRGFRVNLLTNGSLVSAANARDIVEAVNAVSLSLDSAHPEEHDAMRGKSSWRKVMRAIELLRQAGLRYLHLNSVITPANKDTIREFLAFAWQELQAEQVTLAPTGIDVADPTGKWGARGSMLSIDDMWQVYESQRAFSHEIAAQAPPMVPSVSLRRAQCGVGNGLVSVDSNGDLYPCQTMHVPEMRCGNVFETSLGDVIRTSGLLQQVRNLTVDALEDCPTCPMRYVCSGGCRMEAYSREGRITARNRDLCPIFFNRALDKLWMTASVPPERCQEAPARATPLEFFESYA